MKSTYELDRARINYVKKGSTKTKSKERKQIRIYEEQQFKKEKEKVQ